MGATDPRRDRAGQHDRRLLREHRQPYGPDLGEQLAPFDRLEFAISDAAKGIAKAVSDLAGARREDATAPTLEHGLDVFDTTMEAQRLLARQRRHVEAAWGKAEAANREVARSKQQGIDAHDVAQVAPNGLAPGRPHCSSKPSDWKRPGGGADAALDVFGADGRLNDRRHAEAEIALALKGLTGDDWSKVRNFLTDRRSLNFLDRMHRRLSWPNRGRIGARRWSGDGGCRTGGSRARNR